MKISEIMTQPAVMDTAEATLADAARRMAEAGRGSVLVIEGDGSIAGIFTERDLLKAVASGLDPAATRVKEVMTTDVITAGPQTSLKEAAQLMASRWMRHLPVAEEGRVVGMISQRDLTGVLAEALNEPAALHRLLEASALVRERRLKRMEAGDFD